MYIFILSGWETPCVKLRLDLSKNIYLRHTNYGSLYLLWERIVESLCVLVSSVKRLCLSVCVRLFCQNSCLLHGEDRRTTLFAVERDVAIFAFFVCLRQLTLYLSKARIVMGFYGPASVTAGPVGRVLNIHCSWSYATDLSLQDGRFSSSIFTAFIHELIS